MAVVEMTEPVELEVVHETHYSYAAPSTAVTGLALEAFAVAVEVESGCGKGGEGDQGEGLFHLVRLSLSVVAADQCAADSAGCQASPGATPALPGLLALMHDIDVRDRMLVAVALIPEAIAFSIIAGVVRGIGLVRRRRPQVIVLLVVDAQRKLQGCFAGGHTGGPSIATPASEQRPMSDLVQPAAPRGNLWRIAVEYPDSPVPPCIHRAPLP